MSLPFTGNYKDGGLVQCQRCAKNVRVKFYDSDTVVVVSTQEQQTLALRCQYCGYVMCDSCAHPAESLFPTCPACQREWGPYYFSHDVITPSLTKASVRVDVPPTVQTPPLSQPPPQVQDMPVAPVEFLGAGERDLLLEDHAQKRKRDLRKILNLLLIFILVGVVAFSLFGPGKSLLKKGLTLLSARPTRAPTSIVVRNNTPVSLTPGKTVRPTLKVTPTPFKPSVTVGVTKVASPTIKAGLSSSPTQKIATSVALTPTPTSTPVPLPTATIGTPNDCVPALSVTMADLGKKICVIGTVVYTTQKGTAFSIYFSKDEGYLRIVIYDRVPKDIKEGVCIKVTGEIKTLLSSPAMALGYHDVIEICTP